MAQIKNGVHFKGQTDLIIYQLDLVYLLCCSDPAPFLHIKYSV